MCGMVSLMLPVGYRSPLVRWILLTSSLLLLMVTTDSGRLAAQEAEPEYIPATSGLKVRVHQTKLRDSRRAKDLFVRISSPEEKGEYPVIIWSHGSKDSLAEVAQPILFISGDNDKGRHGEQAEWRRDAFDNARAGEKYLVWIRGAHHNFGGISGAPPALSRLIGGRGGDNNEVQLQLVRVATLAFWDMCLKENKKAEAYLTGDGLIKFGRQELKMEHK